MIRRGKVPFDGCHQRVRLLPSSGVSVSIKIKRQISTRPDRPLIDPTEDRIIRSARFLARQTLFGGHAAQVSEPKNALPTISCIGGLAPISWYRLKRRGVTFRAGRSDLGGHGEGEGFDVAE